MGRQCFDFMVQSVYEIPENVVKRVIRNVLKSHADFKLQACESYLEKATNSEKVFSAPIMVNGYRAAYIGIAMPILIQLLDWNSGVKESAIAGRGHAEDLAVEMYHVCAEIRSSLEDAIYEINDGRIQRDNIRYKVQIYLRIS